MNRQTFEQLVAAAVTDAPSTAHEIAARLIDAAPPAAHAALASIALQLAVETVLEGWANDDKVQEMIEGGTAGPRLLYSVKWKAASAG